MNNLFSERYSQLSNWAEQALDDGWINNEDHQKLVELETAEAESLFKNAKIRPLIVAFFGGTGTGKSSLLNRLVGSDIAQTGATRPTSHEVTLYLHQEHQLNQATDDLPMDAARIHYHDIESRQAVAWLDMPDFDSVASANRDLVEKWLPYVDWLVYVVSPERYHDDLGWQILNQRKQRHQWLFVMNHWDEGHPSQFHDFRERLNNNDLATATLLKSSCARPVEDDQFDEIEKTLNLAIEKHGLEQLKETGLRAKLDDLETLKADYLSRLGSENERRTSILASQTLAKEQKKQLNTLLRDQAQAILQPMQLNEDNRAWFKSQPSPNKLPSAADVVTLLSGDRTKQFLQRSAQEQVQSWRNENMPAGALQKSLRELPDIVITTMSQSLEDNVNNALATPGTRLQRALYKLFGWLGFLLPLAVAVWAGWFLFSHYRDGIAGTGSFVEFNFISNTLMLLALAWFIPWLIRRKLQPSLAATFKRGVHAGIDDSSEIFKETLNERVSELDANHQAQLEQLKTISAAY